MDIGSKRLAVGRDTAEFFQDCDAIVGNLEGMITSHRKSRLAQQRHNEEIISSLADAFPVQRIYLIVANNHAADFGVEVFRNTIERLESWGFHVLGQRERPYLDIAECARIVTGSTWSNQSCDWIAEFRDARTVPQIPAINILCPHWGYELEFYPRLHIVQMGQDLLNQFDAIIGHHSHTPQPIARLDCGGKPRLIAYSLGDFCTGIKYRNYRNGIALRITLGRTHGGSWAIGAVEWGFVEIDPTDPDTVTNSLRSQVKFFPAIGNCNPVSLTMQK